MSVQNVAELCAALRLARRTEKYLDDCPSVAHTLRASQDAKATYEKAVRAVQVLQIKLDKMDLMREVLEFAAATTCRHAVAGR